MTRSPCTLRSSWQPTPQKLQVVRTFFTSAGMCLGAFFSNIAPVGQVSMQPPHSSQVVSSSPAPPTVPMVVALPRSVRVMALTASTSSQ